MLATLVGNRPPPCRDLVASLLSRSRGSCVVTHVAGRAEFPDPYLIGRHEPDVIAEAGGVLIIGEAETGWTWMKIEPAYRSPTSRPPRAPTRQSHIRRCVPEQSREIALDGTAAAAISTTTELTFLA